MLLLIVFAPVYLYSVGLRSRPDRAVFAAIGCFLLWPKVGLHLPAFIGMSSYVFIWPITTAALALSVLAHRDVAVGRPDRALRRCLWLAAAAATVSFGASWFLGGEQGLWPNAWEVRLRIYSYLVLMYSVCFSYLFIRSIHRVDQAETVFHLVALGGAAVVAEALLFVYLQVPSPGNLAFDSFGRFQSFFYSSFDDVGFFMILAFSGALYMAMAGRRLMWYVVAGACVLPILATFERAPLLGLLCSGSLVFAVTRRKKVLWFLGLLIACVGLFAILQVFGDDLGRLLGGRIRSDYMSGQTVTIRFALWLRAIELGLASFPWGVGPQMAMSQMSAPVAFTWLHRFAPQDALLWETYHLLLQGEYASNIHNLFFTCFAENGVLGVLSVLFVSAAVMKNLFMLLRGRLPISGEPRRTYLLWACACGALIGLGINYLFEMETFFLFMILPLLHICSICAETLRQAKRRPGVEARSSLPAEG